MTGNANEATDSVKVQGLRAHIEVLEKLLDVHERKSLDQSMRLERALADLDRHTQALVRSNAQLEEFAYVASHDLQEPLRKILAFGERLRGRCADKLDERGLDYLERMESASLRMQRLITDLLAYSRLSTKAQRPTRIALRRVVEEVVVDLEVRIAETGGRIDVGELPELEADTLQMRQLFQNLIGNGLKFRRPDVPPHIAVACAMPASTGSGSIDSGMCEIRISDNGIGFDTKYSDQIFGIFQRLHGRDEFEGTGIGLSICRKIVERHDGTIEAIGAVGEGATFVIRLPLTQDYERTE